MSIHDHLETCLAAVLRQSGQGPIAPRRSPGLSDDEERAALAVLAVAIPLLWDAYFEPADNPGKVVKTGKGSPG